MHYISSKISALIGMVLGVPSAILALIQPASTPAIQSLTLSLGIAGGVLAFLWAIRKYPVEQRLKEAAEIFLENVRLRRLNTDLAEQNERYRVRLANMEESHEHLRPYIEPEHDKSLPAVSPPCPTEPGAAHQSAPGHVSESHPSDR